MVDRIAPTHAPPLLGSAGGLLHFIGQEARGLARGGRGPPRGCACASVGAQLFNPRPLVFLPEQANFASKVSSLKLRVLVTSSGSISTTLYLYAAKSSGVPTGSALSSQSFSNTVSASVATTWTLSPTSFPSLTAGSTYAVVLKSASTNVYWWVPPSLPMGGNVPPAMACTLRSTWPPQVTRPRPTSQLHPPMHPLYRYIASDTTGASSTGWTLLGWGYTSDSGSTW